MSTPFRDGARGMVVGVDFDNTLISYDDLLLHLARGRGWLDSSVARSKRHIRDVVRLLPDGELKWQWLQAEAYGAQIAAAQLPPGVAQFFASCRRHAVPVRIVSHKTEWASVPGTSANLRVVALQWMTCKGFFGPDGFGLSRDDVSFCGTRADKIATIRGLGCTHFIDDLEETFLEPLFPVDVTRVLYAPEDVGVITAEVAVSGRWPEICRYLFHDDR